MEDYNKKQQAASPQLQQQQQSAQQPIFMMPDYQQHWQPPRYSPQMPPLFQPQHPPPFQHPAYFQQQRLPLMIINQQHQALQQQQQQQQPPIPYQYPFQLQPQQQVLQYPLNLTIPPRPAFNLPQQQQQQQRQQQQQQPDPKVEKDVRVKIDQLCAKIQLQIEKQKSIQESYDSSYRSALDCIPKITANGNMAQMHPIKEMLDEMSAMLDKKSEKELEIFERVQAMWKQLNEKAQEVLSSKIDQMKK